MAFTKTELTWIMVILDEICVMTLSHSKFVCVNLGTFQLSINPLFFVPTKTY